MSNCIHFSYIFNEDIERVYECFSNSTLVPEVTFENLVTNVKKIKKELTSMKTVQNFVSLIKAITQWNLK